MSKNIPPKLIKRNEHGLVEGVDYIFKEDGRIDWRTMIPREFLVVNKQFFKGKTVPESIDGLEDNQLLTLLAGSKYLANLHGYNSVHYNIVSSNENYLAATCTINWIGNYENENRSISFSSIGDASPNNTTSFCKNYLGPIAENRAFVRCVRNFLRIQVLSKEEIGGPEVSESTEDITTNLLKDAMVKNNTSFEKVKAYLIKNGNVEAENYKTISEIPKFKAFEILSILKKKELA